jgi:hypothetical protein
MAADHEQEPGMWQQFRRRRVTRTVLLYLVFAFLGLEATLFAAPLVGLPEWAIRVAFGAAVLGFPLAVVLAWTYDVTPRGIVKTPEDLGPEASPSLGPRLAWAVLGAGALAAALIIRLMRI